jgi:hypothetical protein
MKEQGETTVNPWKELALVLSDSKSLKADNNSVNKYTVFTSVIFAIANFRTQIFQAFLEGFSPVFLSLQFCILAW